ncbi:MAG: CBS domain-containing protein [Thermoguttaceae bacterium]|nr:CBS domain-containing protein [Thermoguttaceae bacterium]MDW8079204.1 CBS domain-containing protein [Thermoguttaceae bacterium]
MPKAKDIMTTDVVTISGDATVAEAVALMKSRGVRSLIVERRNEEDAYGMITQRDVVYKVVAKGLDPAQVRVHEIMSKPLVVVNPNLDVKYVARLLANMGLSRAPVIGDHRLLGVVSLSDIVNKAM